VKKDVAIRTIISQGEVMLDDVLMIGDSETDLLAAQANSITFLLRRTKHNVELQNNYDGLQFDDLNDE
jgi:phosphoglycolate phosphatase-like HAD superfamily hydrolase